VRIGHYEVHDELARGGMGVVYRATDTRSGAQVVLKMLAADTERSRRRLQREAVAMRRLAHPSVVTLYDVGEYAGRPFLVLPYLEGESLQDRLDREGPLPPAEVVSIATQVAAGLQAAHALGLLHRDVKPGNVLADGRLHTRIKLTDFGLVKNLDPEGRDSLSLSAGGGWLGTPGYWPPEQARAEPAELGPPADVYGLGALSYALLSGRPPRAAATVLEALDAFDRPLPPLPPHVPAWLADLVQRCLALEPRARPNLTSVLEALSRGEAPPRARRSRPRGKLSAALAAAAAVGVLGVTAALGWPDAAPAASLGAPPGPDPSAVASTRARGVPADPSAATPAQRRRAEEAFQRSLSAARSKRFDEAIAELDRALEFDPAMASAYANRGVFKSILKRYEEALADCDRALELEPEQHVALATRGGVNLELQRYAEALEDLDRAVRVAPDDTRSWVRRGRARAALGHHTEALADFDLALQQNPGLAPAYSDRGRSKAALGRREEAQRDFDRALQLDPDALAVYLRRGANGFALGRYAVAAADYTRALELDPGDAQTHYDRGACLSQLQRFEEAFEDFTRALQLDPQHRDAYLKRGACSYALGRYEQSIGDYDRALELSPDHAGAHFARALNQARLGRHAVAVADLDRALALGGLPATMQARAERLRTQLSAALAKQRSE